MREDKISWMRVPESMEDSLTELLRQGATDLIKQAVGAEWRVFLPEFANVTDVVERKVVVLYGYLPVRELPTSLGPVPVLMPKVFDL